jgi:CHAT domain-containing protein/Tfp pilus assembly protein PilF
LQLPIADNLVGGKPKRFSVRLNAGQTARIEVEHQNLDILVRAYKPSGERYLGLESPSGRSGKKVLLATAETSGEYIIEVAPYHPIPMTIKIKVEITEIRKTTSEDHLTNKTYDRIYKLSLGPNLARRATIAERRDSIRRHKEIIQLSKIVKDKNWEAQALKVIGFDHYSIGEYQSALDYWMSSRELYRALNNNFFEGQIINNIGALFNNLGEYERAVNSFKEAELLQKESTNRFDQAALFANLGSSFFALGQNVKAIEHTKKAYDLYSAMKAAGGKTTQAAALGKIYIASGDYEKGIAYFKKSLEFAESSGHLRQKANTNLSLGKAYWDQGKKSEAHQLFLQANSIADDLGIKQFIVNSLFQLAVVEQDRGNVQAAIDYLENGIKIIEKTRSRIRNKAIRASYFSTVQNLYELYTDLLIERSKKNSNPDDISLALEMSESARARSLIDLLLEAQVDFKTGVDVKLLESGKDVSNELNQKYRSREGLLRRNAKPEQIEKISREINDLELSLEDIDRKILSESPKYADLTLGKTLSTKEIQNLLDKETVLLEYKLGNKRSHLWLVSNGSMSYFELPGKQDIEKAARPFYDLTVKNQRGEEAVKNRLSSRLSDILLSQVSKLTTGKRIAIVADGILQYIPFAALQDADGYLADKNEIVMLPSASVLAQIRKNNVKSVGNKESVAIYADPVFDRGDVRIAENSTAGPNDQVAVLTRHLHDFQFGQVLPRLLSSRREAQHIAGFVSKNKLSLKTDFGASIKNIKSSNLKGHGILHFATHGLLNTTRPELSGLVFSLFDESGRAQDGFLGIDSIYNLELSSDMVVLSACQTALGKEVRGEGLIGISRGFLYAGSKRIVASLWKVDDSATAEFMKRFYRNHLQKGMSASKALREAKLEMKRIPRYRSSFYWSAFTLLGDWK